MAKNNKQIREVGGYCNGEANQRIRLVKSQKELDYGRD